MLRRLVPVLAALALAGLPEAGAGGLSPRSAVPPPQRVVADSTGKFVGYLLGTSFYDFDGPLDLRGLVGHVEVHTGTGAGVLAMTRDRFFNLRFTSVTSPAWVVYGDPSCTSTPYLFTVPAVGYNGLVPLAGLGNGNTFYVQGTGTQVVTIAWTWDDFTGTCGPFPFFGEQTVAPATLLGDLDTLFTPPFHLR